MEPPRTRILERIEGLDLPAFRDLLVSGFEEPPKRFCPRKRVYTLIGWRQDYDALKRSRTARPLAPKPNGFVLFSTTQKMIKVDRRRREKYILHAPPFLYLINRFLSLSIEKAFQLFNDTADKLKNMILFQDCLDVIARLLQPSKPKQLGCYADSQCHQVRICLPVWIRHHLSSFDMGAFRYSVVCARLLVGKSANDCRVFGGRPAVVLQRRASYYSAVPSI